MLNFRDPDAVISFLKTDEGAALVAGKFEPYRVPYQHRYVTEHGDTVIIKFTDTIKLLYDKNFEVRYDRRSYLSYWEIIVAPAGQRPTSKMMDVRQVQIQAPYEGAEAKHRTNTDRLTEIGAKYGIILTDETSWDHTYREGYKQKRT